MVPARAAPAQSTGDPEVLLTERDTTGIVTLTLNRPEKQNALNLELWGSLRLAFDELSLDRSVRCIVLRGASPAFCAGADISEFETVRRDSLSARAYGSTVDATWTAIRNNPHPILAAIDGPCVGGGLELACLADMRVASRRSRFGVPVKRLGLVLAYPELAPVVEVAGPAFALEILLEGRVFGAEDALRMGLVSRAVPDDLFEMEVAKVAKAIASGAPLSARWHKKFVRRLASSEPITTAEQAECFACFDTEDFGTGYRSFLTKTDPVFVGR